MKKIFILFGLLIITISVGLIYFNSLNVPFQHDDVKRIIGIRPAEILDLNEIFSYSKSRFLLYVSFALNYYFGRHNLAGYHGVNIIIHILNSIFVFILCLLIFDSPKLRSPGIKKYSHIFSLFSALIFGLHPLQTESVTYIWQRGESMTATFYFLAMIFYATFRLSQIYNDHKKPRVFIYILCLLSMSVSFLIKPSSATLPAAIFIYEICFLSTDMRSFKKSLKYLIPVLILLVIPFALVKFDSLENEGVGIRFSNYYMPYYYTKLRVLVNSLRLIAVPINQKLEYSFSWSASLMEPITTLYCSIFLVSLFIIAVACLRRDKLVSFAIWWFYLTVSITTLLFLDDIFYEHYLYLPLFGYGLILPVLSLRLIETLKVDRKWWLGFLIIIVAIYGVLAFNRNKVWQTEISLWEDAVKKSPDHARANYTLGVYYFKASRFNEALKQYEAALKLKPLYPEAYYRLGEYYYNLGNTQTAIDNYKRALTLNPEFLEAYINLGNIYLNLQEYSSAKDCFTNALKYTNDPLYKKEMGNILNRIKTYE